MRRGFTLVEVMIVVAIIALLAAIAIPNLLRARVSAQEGNAAVALHAVSVAEVQWRATHPTYASLASLGNATPPYIDNALASSTKQGYIFNVTTNATSDTFFATARQANNQSSTFYIDEDGILCRSNSTGEAEPGSHKAAGNNCPANFTQMQ